MGLARCMCSSFVLALSLLSIPYLAVAEISVSDIVADNRPVILFDTFGFSRSGRIHMNVSDVKVYIPENGARADKSLMGFFITTAAAELALQDDLRAGQCVLGNGRIHRLFTLQEAEAGKLADGMFVFQYAVPDAHEYSLFFANCQNHVMVSMKIKFALFNVEANGRNDFLPAGKTELPRVYFAFFLAYIIAGAAWVYFCYTHWSTSHRIHGLMAVLIFFKALTVLSQAGEYAYIKATGVPQGWNIAFYVFSFFRGIMLFTVIVLIGTGWSFLKPFLQDKEKKVMMIVIPLQVFANIATIILDESGPSSRTWFTWRDIFHLLDIICCCAILFPIVWSIKHLRDASQTDGKAARNMMKLTLFQQFYAMVVGYIYFTRIIVYLLKNSTPYHYAWTADLAGESATLLFYCITGYAFRPIESNPYFVLDEEVENSPESQALKGGKPEDDDEFDL